MESGGVVVKRLLITQPFSKEPVKVEKMEILLAGIRNDKHFGKTILSTVREKKLVSKGTEVANLRAITIVSQEELNEISAEMGVEVLPEDLEANITLEGLPSLTQLAPGTFLKFPRNCVLFVTGENFPCVIPAQNMMRRGVDKLTAVKFSKTAFHKRGLISMPYASGFIKEDDVVEVFPPSSFE